jgi:LL-diaminopimelate aminotransferase
MQHAKRLDLIPPYLFGEIARAKRAAIDAGQDLIDLGIGDPDQPTPQPVIDRLHHEAQDPETHRYDESPAGDPVFLNAACEWFARRYGVTLDPKSEIIELIGSKDGLAHLCWAFVDPGDYTLVQDPSYTVPKVNTLLAGGIPHPVKLLPEKDWRFDFASIPTDIAKKAKILFLNYPHNPTGGSATPEFFAEAVEFARSHSLLLCQDCAYAEVGYEGYQPPSILQTPGAKELAVETHSLSKTMNMTGWRIGFAVGNPDALAALNKLKSNVDSKQFAAIARAGGWALNHADNSATFALYQKRRDILVDGLNSLGWKLNKPRAGFFVWAPVPQGYTSAEFIKILIEKAGVLAIPGSGYGENGEGWFRMSLTLSDKSGERVAEAIERIKNNVPIRW